jgi:chemotaxis protein MotA
MDFTTIVGIVVGIGAILLTNALEGGHTAALIQVTAFVVIFGGTAGAVMVAFPLRDLLAALKLSRYAFFDKAGNPDDVVRNLVDLAQVARRDGVLALEARLASIEDPFLARAVGLLVDGVDAAVARDTLESEIDADYEGKAIAAKVFESGGGYSPTIGILGAVLGLIHVMNNLNDPSSLGPGIAVAFTATIYGVGLANLVLLPVGSKLRRKFGLERNRKRLIAEGVLAIQEGLNPRVLEDKLRAQAGLPEPRKEAA